jgi:hypothetical protein
VKTKFKLGVLIAAAVLSVLPAAAEDTQFRHEGENWVQVVTGSLLPARALKVDTDLGSIHVTGGNSSNIQYVITKKVNGGTESAARRLMDQFRITVSSRSDTAIIEGNSETGRYKRFSIDIAIQVPRNIDLVRIETSAGGISVNNISGRAMVETSGGGIILDGVGGSINASTAGGGISISNANSDAKLETQGGGITLKNVRGRITASTAGGGIDLADADNDVRLETAGGCISLKNVKGKIVANTAGGSIDVSDARQSAALESAGGSISARTVDGPVTASTAGGGIRLYKLAQGVKASTAAGPITVEIIAKRGQFTDSFLETSVGDIVVYLPADLGVTVKAAIDTAMGHRIRSDFPELKVSSEGGDYGPREIYASGAINGGGPTLKLHTTMGSIELRKGTR